MNNQLIISIGREFGSGGHVIAEELSKRFNIPLYDHNLLDHIAEDMGIEDHDFKKYDEKPRFTLFSRKVRGHSTSMEDHLVRMQFKFLQNKADNGESFVIVGRCAEHHLSHNKNMVTVFVLGHTEEKIKRIMEVYNLSYKEAEAMAKRNDLARKSYHNHYCKGKWGDSRNYHLSINSSVLGIEKTVDFIENFVKEKRAINEQ
ncbi:MAG: cytidylate kinase-like family protein [Ruminococcaceae bacterium]|nr:cytidylate kinase-like family protein [Oscillospiraceae bacterium]